jgi:prepilin-type N-terminal cleavage/methylation domain-containing protein
MQLKLSAGKQGFTLVELMVAMMISIIVLLGVGGVLADAAKGWNQMYNRVNGGIILDAYVAGNTFNSVVRKCTYVRPSTDCSAQDVYVYYYSTLTSTVLDRYARFYQEGNTLMVEYGNYNAGVRTSVATNVLANNVTAVNFSITPGSAAVKMVLTLDDTKHSITVTCSAIRHNP